MITLAGNYSQPAGGPTDSRSVCRTWETSTVGGLPGVAGAATTTVDASARMGIGSCPNGARLVASISLSDSRVRAGKCESTARPFNPATPRPYYKVRGAQEWWPAPLAVDPSRASQFGACEVSDVARVGLWRHVFWNGSKLLLHFEEIQRAIHQDVHAVHCGESSSGYGRVRGRRLPLRRRTGRKSGLRGFGCPGKSRTPDGPGRSRRDLRTRLAAKSPALPRASLDFSDRDRHGGGG
jgi:hypothetical protein